MLIRPTLTQFIKQKEVSRTIAQLISIPKNPIVNQVALVPSTTVHFALIGIAFDLLLRCYLFREYSKHSKTKWHLQIGQYLGGHYRYAFEDAEKEIKRYFKEGKFDKKLFRACYTLAQLEAFTRCGVVKHLGRVPRGVVEELEKLISIVDIKKFQPNKYIILNPDFNTLETAVRCADCDLIIDDTLIEIKTVKNGRSNSYFWKQLIGYYYLSKIGGINKPNIFSKEMELIEILEKSKYRKKPKLIKDIEIKRIGIYYSRYGILHIEPIDKIISSLDNHKALEKIMTEFVLVEPIQDNLTRKIVHSL